MSRESIYEKDDITITLRVNPALHKLLSVDAKKQYRSLPMHTASILSKYVDKFMSTEKQETNNPLYTEDELKDIYKQHREREDNGRI